MSGQICVLGSLPLTPMIPAWLIRVSACYHGKVEQAVIPGAGEPPPLASAGTSYTRKVGHTIKPLLSYWLPLTSVYRTLIASAY